MKKTLKMMAMLLCIASIATLSSCTKEKFDANELIGTTWKCTYNCKTDNCEENAYVGTIWALSSEKVPYTTDEYYAYKNGVKVGSYYIQTDGPFAGLYMYCMDEEWNEDWPYNYDDFLSMSFDKVEITNNELVLSDKVTNYDGSRTLQVILKFVQQ